MPKRSRSHPPSSPSSPSSSRWPSEALEKAAASASAERLVHAVRQRIAAATYPHELPHRLVSLHQTRTRAAEMEEGVQRDEAAGLPSHRHYTSPVRRLPSTWMISLHQHREEEAGRRRAAESRAHRHAKAKIKMMKREEEGVCSPDRHNPSTAATLLGTSVTGTGSLVKGSSSGTRTTRREASGVGRRGATETQRSLVARLRDMPQGPEERHEIHRPLSSSSLPLPPPPPPSFSSSSTTVPTPLRETAASALAMGGSETTGGLLPRPLDSNRPAGRGRRRCWTREKLGAVLAGTTRPAALRRFFGTPTATDAMNSRESNRTESDGEIVSSRRGMCRRRRRRALRQHLSALRQRAEGSKRRRETRDAEREQDKRKDREGGEARDGLETPKKHKLPEPTATATDDHGDDHSVRRVSRPALSEAAEDFLCTAPLGTQLSQAEYSSRAMFWAMVHAVVEERRRVVLGRLLPALALSPAPSSPSMSSSSSLSSPPLPSLLEARAFPLFGLEVDVCTVQFCVTTSASRGRVASVRGGGEKTRGRRGSRKPFPMHSRPRGRGVTCATPCAVLPGIRRGIVLQESLKYVSVALLPQCSSSTAFSFLCDVSSPHDQREDEEGEAEKEGPPQPQRRRRLPQPQVVRVQKQFTCCGTLADVCQRLAAAWAGRRVSAPSVCALRPWRRDLRHHHCQHHCVTLTLAIVAGEPWEPRYSGVANQSRREDASRTHLQAEQLACASPRHGLGSHSDGKNGSPSAAVVERPHDNGSQGMATTNTNKKKKQQQEREGEEEVVRRDGFSDSSENTSAHPYLYLLRNRCL